MSFNFKSNKMIYYHNNNEAGAVKLVDYTKIIPAFSLYGHSTQIEITRYDYS